MLSQSCPNFGGHYKMFGLSELKQTRVYQQGREEGERTLIIRLLSRRVGSLPESVRQQLDELPLAALETLGEALLDFSGLSDLERWLQAHAQQAEG